MIRDVVLATEGAGAVATLMVVIVGAVPGQKAANRFGLPPGASHAAVAAETGKLFD